MTGERVTLHWTWWDTKACSSLTFLGLEVEAVAEVQGLSGSTIALGVWRSDISSEMGPLVYMAESTHPTAPTSLYVRLLLPTRRRWIPAVVHPREETSASSRTWADGISRIIPFLLSTSVVLDIVLCRMSNADTLAPSSSDVFSCW